MRDVMRRLTETVARCIPARVTHRLVKVPLVQAILFRLVDKGDAELLFQKVWARRFSRNPRVLEDYWREYRELDRVRELATETSRILDVGCGVSTVLHLLPGKRVGVDALADSYRKLYDYPPDILVRQATAESLPFEDASFDLVFCTNALDHMSSPLQALGEMHRVLQAQGRLVLTVEIFDEHVGRDPAHPHALNESNVRELLDAARFRVEYSALRPWIGISRYAEGLRTSNEHEFFVIAAPANGQ